MDTTIIKAILGFLGTALLLMTGWTHFRASNAHDKIDKERKDNEERFNDLHEKVNRHRQETERDMANHMTETQIKDFVDRSVKPIKDAVDEVKSGLNGIEKSNSQISSDVRVLNTLMTKLLEKEK